MLFVDAHPLLPEKDRPRRIDLDGKAEDEQQRREHDHAAEGQMTASSRLMPFRYMEDPPFSEYFLL